MGKSFISEKIQNVHVMLVKSCLHRGHKVMTGTRKRWLDSTTGRFHISPPIPSSYDAARLRFDRGVGIVFCTWYTAYTEAKGNQERVPARRHIGEHIGHDSVYQQVNGSMHRPIHVMTWHDRRSFNNLDRLNQLSSSASLSRCGRRRGNV